MASFGGPVRRAWASGGSVWAMVPEPIEDATLGRFHWDPENELWLGTFDIPPDNSARLTVQVGPSDRAAVLALARETVARMRELDPEARRFVAAELRRAEASEELSSGPVDIERAVGLMVLKSANVEPGGMVKMIFGSEGMFGGVDLFVWFDRDGDRGITVLHDSRLP